MNPRAHDAPSKGAHKKPADSPDRLWSGRVTRTSNALDLEEGVFALDDPREIARSLKHSAEMSTRRKSESRQWNESDQCRSTRRTATTRSTSSATVPQSVPSTRA